MFKKFFSNSLVAVLFIIISINLIINKRNYLFILVILISLFYIIFINIRNFKIILFYLIIISIFIILFLVVPRKYNYNYLINLINNKSSFFYLRNTTLEYIKQIHNNKIYNFISMIIFNEKHYNYDLFLELKNLGIVHLFTISGFHINLLLLFVNKYLIKNKKFNFWFNILFVIFYGYFLKFSVSWLRVFTYYFLRNWFSKYNALLFGAFINLILFCHLSINFGFLLSYGCTLLIFRISDLDVSQITKTLLINLLCTVFSNIILISINKEINISSIIFNFIYSPIAIIIYIFVFLTWYIPFSYLIESFYLILVVINKIMILMKLSFFVPQNLIPLIHLFLIPFEFFLLTINNKIYK